MSHECTVPVKLPMEEIIGERTTKYKTSVGEKTKSMLIHCRYFS